jgi:hypothetical protein
MERLESMADDDVNHFFKEWEATRDVLKTFDGYLHDLRKYGFSFITALLTGSAILFTTWIRQPIYDDYGAVIVEGELFPEHVKAAILAVTLFLIIGLFMIDTYYRLFQKTANIRSRILEKVLNIELSDAITQRYHSSIINQYLVSGVYCIFILGVLSLGISVLSNSLFWLSLIVLGSLLAVMVLSLGARFFYFIHYDYGLMDWILDRLECGVGDEVRVIMTNIGDEPIPISANKAMWNLFKEGGNVPLRSGVTPADIEIGSFQNYMWVLRTGADEKRGEEKLEHGIYRIEVRPLQKNSRALGPEGEMRPLSRKLRIKPSSEPQVHHVKLIKNTKKHAPA